MLSAAAIVGHLAETVQRFGDEAVASACVASIARYAGVPRDRANLPSRGVLEAFRTLRDATDHQTYFTVLAVLAGQYAMAGAIAEELRRAAGESCSGCRARAAAQEMLKRALGPRRSTVATSAGPVDHERQAPGSTPTPRSARVRIRVRRTAARATRRPGLSRVRPPPSWGRASAALAHSHGHLAVAAACHDLLCQLGLEGARRSATAANELLRYEPLPSHPGQVRVPAAVRERVARLNQACGAAGGADVVLHYAAAGARARASADVEPSARCHACAERDERRMQLERIQQRSTAAARSAAASNAEGADA